MRAVLLGLISLLPFARAEIIDRIAVTLNNRVITESMVIAQIRLAAFTDGRQPSFTPAEKRRAADTLTAQILLIQEMDDTRYPPPPMTEVIDRIREEIQSRFPSAEAFRQELALFRISEDELRRFTQAAIRSVNFIDLRFRRGQQVTTDEIGTYYQQDFRTYWNRVNPGKPLPPLDEVSEDIEDWILSARTDKATEEWLEQTKRLANIRYREEVFR